MTNVSFTAYVKPEPQGSKRGFVVPGKNGVKPRAVVVDSNQKTMRGYRDTVRYEAMVALQMLGIEQPMCEAGSAVAMAMEFVFVRPKSVKRPQHTVKPDIDKLERSTLDALTGVLFADDSQVVRVDKTKVYGDVEKVIIAATRL